MTKFILHGGFTVEENELNAGFYREIVKDLVDGATVLLVYFAADERRWSELSQQDKARFVAQSPGKRLNFVIASKEGFAEEVQTADSVYLRGGEVNLLVDVLKRYPDFAELVEGKVVAGSSAGAYALAKYYHSADKSGIYEGLGLLPVRVVCHYDSDKFKKGSDPIAEMGKYPKDFELVVLRDYEWKAFEVI